jgi:hypothetical protein
MNDIRDWARIYRSRGFALCRPNKGTKRPTCQGWNRKSLEPEDFRPSSSIGVMPGRLSGDIVCLDLDDREALAMADEFLPPTGLIEGRPGKRASHRYFRVVNTPPELTAPATVAGGIGGPRTKFFWHSSGRMLVEFRGTGSHVVVPPSIWTGADGAQERREWESFGAPAVVDCQELFDATTRLATACGWKPKHGGGGRRKKGAANDEVAPEALVMPTRDAARLARAYLAKVPPADEAKGGGRLTWWVACLLVIDFALSPEEALPILAEWNQRCLPPWALAELRHKLACADALPDRKRGWRGRGRARTYEVNILPGEDTVLVGVDCAVEGRSYVSMSTMGAALVKSCRGRVLVPELEAIDWGGKAVLLTPPSTVRSNKTEVWVEFFLARALREKGATVQSFHPQPKGGRKTTYSSAADGELVDPPEDPWEANARAEQASQRARDLDAYRKALPRKKGSPALEKALAFVEGCGITRMTRDAIEEAAGRGISRSTLRRAILLYSERKKKSE